METFPPPQLSNSGDQSFHPEQNPQDDFSFGFHNNQVQQFAGDQNIVSIDAQEAITRPLQPQENLDKPQSAPVHNHPDGSPKKRGRSVAFSRECVLSPELAAFLGKDRMTRSEVVSNMWKTIRDRGLIDVNHKQFAGCDDQLFKVIGKKRFKVFGMMKYLKDHIHDPAKMTTKPTPNQQDTVIAS